MSSHTTSRIHCWLVGVLLLLLAARSSALEPEVPARFADRLSTLQQTENPAKFVETALPLLGNAKAELPADQFAAVRLSIADGAKKWLLTSTTVNASSTEVDQLMIWGGSRLTAQERQAVARAWLLEQDAVSRFSPVVIARLTSWGSAAFSDEERERLQKNIDSKFPDVQGMSFAQLDAKMRMSGKLVKKSHETTKARREVVAQWARTHDTSQLDAESLNRLVLYLPPTIPQFTEFHLEWTGSITPPQSGDYKFSISPFNIGVKYEKASHRQEMTVTINETTVISANSDKWEYEGKPITLTANQPVALRVRLSYSLHNAIQRALPAQLYWSGPGLSRQIIPASVLTTAQGNQSGLNAIATFTDKQKVMHTQEAIVPNIDNVFQGNTLCTYGDVFRPLITRRLNQLTADEYLVGELITARERDRLPPQTHDLLARPANRLIVRFCTSAERKECARRLIAHPQVIAGARFDQALSLYNALRFGAEREALDMLGTWMQLNCDLQPRLVDSTKKFIKVNRLPYREAVVSLFFEYPESIRWLEDGYLETRESKCSLPAAYTLAYAYLTQGKIGEWIHRLESKLAKADSTGDNRVNWLIARAMAEEIRRGPASRFYAGNEQLSAGRKWLEEASRVAESAPNKRRIAKEQVCRLAALQQWSAAEGELTAFSDLPGVKRSLAALKEKAAKRAEQQPTISRQAYVDELKRRRDQAAQQGNTDEAGRYSQLISESEQPAK